MLFRFIFLLLVLFFSRGSYAAWCNKDCGEKCKKDYIQDKGYQNLTSLSNGAYTCPNKYSTSTTVGAPTIRAKIGWSDTCATPSGDNLPSKSSCLSTHNLLGKVIDIFLTLGIAVAMFEQFCSFSAGDPNLEGAIISNDFLSKCSGLQHLRHKKRCMSCIFQGLSYDGTNHVCSTCTSGSDIINSSPQCQDCQSQGTGASCAAVCQTGVCITSNVNNHLLSSSSICNGIPNFDKPVVNSSGDYAYDTDSDNNKIPIYCPFMRCNIPTNDIITKYYDTTENRTAIIGALAAAAAALAAETGGLSVVAGAAMTLAAALTGDCCDVDHIQNDTVEHVGFWGAVNLKGKIDGDRICAEMLMPDGYTTVACKFRVPPPVVYPPTKCTLSNTACVYGAHTHGLWVMPITATIMECVSDIMGLFFEPHDGSSLSCPTNHLFLFQAHLRNIVRIMLILYVVIFGINLAFSSSPIKKGEIFSFIFKFAMVTYFAVGTFTVTSNVGKGEFNAQEARSVQYNGLEYLNKLANSVINSFAGIIINSSGWTSGSGVAPCMFDPNDSRYQNNGNDYSYLFLWDSLDCHLAFYLGLASPTAQGLSSVNQGSGSIASGLGGAGIATLLLPAFFAFELFLLVFVVAFTVFLFSLMIYFTNLYIVAMLAVSVLIFFGPFFIPMALFKYTKRMFDAWINLVFGYALQPAVISAFLALFITTFYIIFYSGCTFTSANAGGLFPYWSIASPVSDSCKESLGYITAQLNPDVAFKRVAFAGGLFYYTGFSTWLTGMEGMLDALMLCTFFAFLFYYFAEQLSGLAADLTGSMVLGNVVSPNALTDLAVNKIGSKLSAWREKRNQKQAPKTGRQGINVSSAGKGGVSVSSSSPSSGRGGVNVSSVPSSSSGGPGGSSVSSPSSGRGGVGVSSVPSSSSGGQGGSSASAQSNRDALKEMPFGQEAQAYDDQQSNQSALQELPFAGMGDVRDRRKEQQRSDKAEKKATGGSKSGGDDGSSQGGSTSRSGTSSGSALGGVQPNKSLSSPQGGSSTSRSGASGGSLGGGEPVSKVSSPLAPRSGNVPASGDSEV